MCLLENSKLKLKVAEKDLVVYKVLFKTLQGYVGQYQNTFRYIPMKVCDPIKLFIKELLVPCYIKNGKLIEGKGIRGIKEGYHFYSSLKQAIENWTVSEGRVVLNGPSLVIGVFIVPKNTLYYIKPTFHRYHGVAESIQFIGELPSIMYRDTKIKALVQTTSCEKKSRAKSSIMY